MRTSKKNTKKTVPNTSPMEKKKSNITLPVIDIGVRVIPPMFTYSISITSFPRLLFNKGFCHSTMPRMILEGANAVYYARVIFKIKNASKAFKHLKTIAAPAFLPNTCFQSVVVHVNPSLPH
jgi:hypothetical protein